jgi:archaellum component FlaC
MSSSRSIAAARNRRASGGEQQPPSQRPRPNTSIGSQAAFAQQQQISQQNMRQGQQRQSQPQRNFQSGPTPGSVPVAVNKISVSDAIGLITIRLGRIEQFMQNLDESNGMQIGSENVQLIDKDVVNSLTDRIYTLENKPSSENVDQIKNKISSLEKEVKDLKELLKAHTSKFASFMAETEQKFSDVDAAFVELEKDTQIIDDDQNGNDQYITDSENVQLLMQEVKEDNLEHENNNGPTFSSVDLKSVINQELANSEI